MGTTFQTGDTETAGVTRFLLEIPLQDAWIRAALLQAVLLMCNENNWFQQGEISIDRAVEIANDMFATARFEDDITE